MTILGKVNNLGVASVSLLLHGLMAVPSFLAVTAFEPFLPIGFGIAAGAMVWMVFAELIPDANKNASSTLVGITVTLAFAFMIAFQYLVLR
jgi:zinc transporter ZupT